MTTATANGPDRFTENVSRSYTVRVLYTCNACRKAKAPGAAVRVDYTKRVVGTRTVVLSQGSEREDLLPPTWHLEDGTLVPNLFYANDPPERTCGCGRTMEANRIAGHYNPDVPCTAKCTGAVGHVCECSCGGKNHGRSHL
jgi:hypothetical protein